MKIDLAGFGPGAKELATRQTVDALSSSDVIITSARLAGILREEQNTAIPGTCFLKPDVRIFEETRSAQICALLENFSVSDDFENVLCLFGGDSSFYSGAAPVLKRIEESDSLMSSGVQVRVLPGISSLSAACARLQIPIREAEVFSAHGRDCDPVRAVMNGKKSFFLTSGSSGPAGLCRDLVRAGLGMLEVTVCEMLSTKSERIRVMTAEQAAEETFQPLSVLFIDPAPVSEYIKKGIPGIADGAFQRGPVPMTKRFVRTGILSVLAPSEGEVCWDLGAGTGSVSIEMCAHCRRVISVERNPEAVCLLEENRKRFGAWNMQIIRGEIVGTAAKLPVPDAIFVGGGGGQLSVILDQLQKKVERIVDQAASDSAKAQETNVQTEKQPARTGEQPVQAGEQSVQEGLDFVKYQGTEELPARWTVPKAANGGTRMPRICAAAVTLETLFEVREALENHNYDTQVVQIAVTDVKERGHFHMMDAQNPVFLIEGLPGGTEE